jgi:glycosyltransferase involved in cell wall biosynthesis
MTDAKQPSAPEGLCGPVNLGSSFRAGLVSVVMPSYNSAAYLGEAVASVLAQTYRVVELLVVDDGSSDDSPRILAELQQRHPEFLRAFRQPNTGPYPARNLGLRHANGEYIAFLDADDYWHPTFLSRLLTQIRVTDSDLAYCGWQNVGVQGGFGDPYVPPRYEAADGIERFLETCPWPIHAALMRRELMTRLRGFSERYFTSMDFDLWLRARAASQRMALVPEVLAFYRWHEKGQISAVKARQVRDAWQVRRDFIAAYPGLVAHLDAETLRDKTDGFLLANAQRAYWQRDLVTAHSLFRLAVRSGAMRIHNLRHLLPSLLPQRLYCALVSLADRRHGV